MKLERDDDRGDVKVDEVDNKERDGGEIGDLLFMMLVNVEEVVIDVE